MFYMSKLRLMVISACFLVACGGSENRESEYFERAKVYFEASNYDKTRVELKNVLQINPKNIDARYLLALLAEKNQDWRQMYGLLLGVIEEKPEFIDAQNKLGKLFLLSGQIDKALESSEFVLVKDKSNTDALILKAAVLMRQTKLLESEAILKSVLADVPGHVEATLMLSKQYADNDKVVEALAWIEKALVLHPNDMSLSLFKINDLVALKDFSSAEKVFVSLIAHYPDKAGLHYNFAKFYIAWNKLAEGEAVLREYIALKPDETEPKLALAEFLLQNKGAIEAEKSLHEFIEKNADNLDFRFALAKVYQDTPERAIGVLHEIVDADKDGVAGLKANNLLAMFAVKQGNKDQALHLLNDIIKKDARNSSALMLRSSLLVDAGDLEAAIADLRVVLRDNPESEKAYTLSANAHLKSGFFDLAEDSLEKVLLLNPENVEVRKNLARLMVKNKDNKAAIVLLESAEEKTPDVLSMLVDLYIKAGDWDKAINRAQLISSSKLPGLPSFKLAQIYFAQHRYELAVENYLLALAAQPLDINVLREVSRAYLAMNKPSKAENLLDELLVKNPENVRLLNLRGVLHRSLKQYSKAQVFFERAIDLDVKSSEAYRNLASIYLMQKDFLKALETFNEGLLENPENPSLLIGLAGVYETQENLDAAITTYTRLLEVDQTNKIAANNLAALIAKTSEDPVRLKYALSLVEVFKNYKVPELLDTYGWLSYLNGEYENALVALEKVVAIVPDFPEFEYHLGMIYVANGRTEEAKIALEKATTKGAQFVGFELAKAKLAELKNKEV